MLVYFIAILITASIASVACQIDLKSWDSRRIPRNLGILGVLLATILSLISAFRWRVGTDYDRYYRLFPQYVEDWEQGVLPWEEPGIRAIAWIVSRLGGDGVGMLGIAAILTVFLTVRSIWRWSPALTFACVLYILSGAWYGSFNAVRQYLAAAILLAGHRHIIDRHFFRWILIVLIASLFHVSALVGILFYFVPRNLISIPGQITVIALSVAALYGSDVILEAIDGVHRQGAISDTENAVREVNPLRVAFAFVPLAIYWLTPTPKIIEENKGGFYVNMLLVFAACMLAASNSVFLSRFILYPQLFIGLGLAYVTAYENRRDKALIRAGLLVLFGIFMLFEVNWNSDLRNFYWVFERES